MSVSEPPALPATLAADGLALYIARRLAADSGFVPGIPLAFVELASAWDMGLHFVDGFGASIVLLIDAEGEVDRTFGLDPLALAAAADRVALELAADRREVASSFPVTIRVIEVHARPLGRADRERLAGLEAAFPATGKVGMVALAVEAESGEVHSPRRLGTWSRAARELRRWAREPRAAAEELVREAGPAARLRRVPAYATSGLLAALATVYGVEAAVSQAPATAAIFGPDIEVVVGMGALVAELAVHTGQWWRLATAVLLHGNLVHLALNSLVLWIVGRAVEGLVGRSWFLALFCVGGLAGSLASMQIYGGRAVSVGASGAIMALLAAAAILARRLPPGARRDHMRRGVLQVLVPSLLPVFGGPGGTQIDYAAHAGGAVAGALLGTALMAAWPRDRPRPPAELFARMVMAATVAMIVVGTINVRFD